MNNKKLRFKSRLRLESLEKRLLMAGDVTVSVSGGVLTVRGDANPNSIQISGTGVAGQYLISGFVDDTLNLPTTVNHGAAPVLVTGVTGDVIINLGNGNDELGIDNAVVAGNLIINDDGGANFLELGQHSLLVNKDVVVNTAGNGDQTILEEGIFTVGNHTVTTGGGNDYLNLIATGAAAYASTGKNETISTGAGYDVYTVGSMYVQGALSVDTGSEADLISIVNTGVGGSAKFVGGSGDDILAFDHLTVGGNLTVDGGSGNDQISFNVATINGETNILGGSGIDQIKVAGATAKKVTLDAGNDQDHVQITTSKVDSLFAFLGGGDDDITISQSTVTGNALLDGGSGKNTFVNGGGNIIGGTLTVTNFS